MQRLSEYQIVQVSPPGYDLRIRTFPAYVLAVDGRVVALGPLDPVDLVLVPPELPETLLLFEHGSRRIALVGTLLCAAGGSKLQFRVTDDAYIPRARSSRIRLCAAVTLTPLDAPGEGGVVHAKTADVGPDGALLEPAPALAAATLVGVALILPGDVEPVEATGVLTPCHADEERREIRFEGAGPYRRRLRAFVLQESRQRLAMLLRVQEDDDPSW